MKFKKVRILSFLSMVGVVGVAYGAWTFDNTISYDQSINVGIDEIAESGTVTIVYVSDASDSTNTNLSSIVLTKPSILSTTTFNICLKHTQAAKKPDPATYKYTSSLALSTPLSTYIQLTSVNATAWNSSTKVAPGARETGVIISFKIAWKGTYGVFNTKAEYDSFKTTFNGLSDKTLKITAGVSIK